MTYLISKNDFELCNFKLMSTFMNQIGFTESEDQTSCYINITDDLNKEIEKIFNDLNIKFSKLVNM